jgi:hypothetical protein
MLKKIFDVLWTDFTFKIDGFGLRACGVVLGFWLPACELDSFTVSGTATKGIVFGCAERWPTTRE